MPQLCFDHRRNCYYYSYSRFDNPYLLSSTLNSALAGNDRWNEIISCICPSVNFGAEMLGLDFAPGAVSWFSAGKVPVCQDGQALQHPKSREKLRTVGAVRHTTSAAQIFRQVLPPRLLPQELQRYDPLDVMLQPFVPGDWAGPAPHRSLEVSTHLVEFQTYGSFDYNGRANESS